jgi:sensor domain CHASE-containing protein
VLYVNLNAVTYKGNGLSSVLVYEENGNVVEREIKTGFTDGRYVEIVSAFQQRHSACGKCGEP